jgi:hypothetical protein
MTHFVWHVHWGHSLNVTSLFSIKISGCDKFTQENIIFCGDMWCQAAINCFQLIPVICKSNNYSNVKFTMFIMKIVIFLFCNDDFCVLQNLHVLLNFKTNCAAYVIDGRSNQSIVKKKNWQKHKYYINAILYVP